MILQLAQVLFKIYEISHHTHPLFLSRNVCLIEFGIYKRFQWLTLISSLIRVEKFSRSISAVQKSCYILHPRVILFNLLW